MWPQRETLALAPVPGGCPRQEQAQANATSPPNATLGPAASPSTRTTQTVPGAARGSGKGGRAREVRGEGTGRGKGAGSVRGGAGAVALCERHEQGAEAAAAGPRCGDGERSGAGAPSPEPRPLGQVGGGRDCRGPGHAGRAGAEHRRRVGESREGHPCIHPLWAGGKRRAGEPIPEPCGGEAGSGGSGSGHPALLGKRVPAAVTAPN